MSINTGFLIYVFWFRWNNQIIRNRLYFQDIVRHDLYEFICVFFPPSALVRCEQEDIVFVVDSSGSIQRSNWPLILEFMKNIVRGFNIGPDQVRIGVSIFGNNVFPQFQLNTFTTADEVLRQIDRIPYLDQSTNTPEALRYMREVMFSARNGDRAFVPNSAILITDGVPRIPTNFNEALRLTILEADLARQQGINIFAIGVGPEITQSNLNQIANQPSNQYTFKVDQFQELENILYQVASATCGDTVTVPPLPGIKNLSIHSNLRESKLLKFQ